MDILSTFFYRKLFIKTRFSNYKIITFLCIYYIHFYISWVILFFLMFSISDFIKVTFNKLLDMLNIYYYMAPYPFIKGR
jgi:hypothetical protein